MDDRIAVAEKRLVHRKENGAFESRRMVTPEPQFNGKPIGRLKTDTRHALGKDERVLFDQHLRRHAENRIDTVDTRLPDAVR